MDFCLKTRKLVVIEGHAQIGKSTGVRAWSQMHLGEARFCILGGIINQTTLFRTLARALGLPSTYALTPTKMQARVEDMLQRSRLMLIIDEAHYLWPQQKRITTRPVLIDWVNTALVNHGVPVALIGTPQFSHCRREVEKQTGWTSEQFTGRTRRHICLPFPPSRKDLQIVAQKLLPEGSKESIQLIVGYAIASSCYMPAVEGAVDEARLQAGRRGSNLVTFEDVRKAIEEYRIPSDKAQARASQEPEHSKKGRSFRTHPVGPSQMVCGSTERPPDSSLGTGRTNQPQALASGQPKSRSNRMAEPAGLTVSD